MLDHPELKVSETRPKLIINLLQEHMTILNDLVLSEKEEDGHFIGCTFGVSDSKYEYRKGTEYGEAYGTNTYHKHDFVIRINGHNLFICKQHLKFLSILSKELAPLG